MLRDPATLSKVGLGCRQGGGGDCYAREIEGQPASEAVECLGLREGGSDIGPLSSREAATTLCFTQLPLWN